MYGPGYSRAGIVAKSCAEHRFVSQLAQSLDGALGARGRRFSRRSLAHCFRNVRNASMHKVIGECERRDIYHMQTCEWVFLVFNLILDLWPTTTCRWECVVEPSIHYFLTRQSSRWNFGRSKSSIKRIRQEGAAKSRS